eukprot:TRINITY_DN102659_c0_g1_i1.p1 TRINITY_DN102659_c0_g1~~TRINITY_DN102659_c0_g1_i1.p1  ORF type:complete len:332 (+),score=75.82 TRINITY_DN102659_c0_g1_i1:80-1075(+)
MGCRGSKPDAKNVSANTKAPEANVEEQKPLLEDKPDPPAAEPDPVQAEAEVPPVQPEAEVLVAPELPASPAPEPPVDPESPVAAEPPVDGQGPAATQAAVEDTSAEAREEAPPSPSEVVPPPSEPPSSVFHIVLEKFDASQVCGMKVLHPDNTFLVVTKLKERGLVPEWNTRCDQIESSAPHRKVQIGDWILEVNGKAGDPRAMLDAMKEMRVAFKIKRPTESEQADLQERVERILKEEEEALTSASSKTRDLALRKISAEPMLMEATVDDCHQTIDVDEAVAGADSWIAGGGFNGFNCMPCASMVVLAPTKTSVTQQLQADASPPAVLVS